MSVLSSKSEKKAINRAADISRQTTNDILAQNEKFFNQIQQNQQPYLDLGNKAVGLISNELNAPLTESASYKFQYNQLNKEADKRAAALGLLNSGNRVLQSLDITNKLAADEQSRRDSLLRSAFATGYGATGLNTQTVANQSANNANLLGSLGNTLANAEIAKGQVNSSLFKNLGNLALTGAGAFGTGGFGGLGSLFKSPSISGGFSDFSTSYA